MRILIACVNVCDAAEADFLCIAGYELTADQNPLLIITPDIRRLTGKDGVAEDWCIVGSLCTPNDVLVRRVSMPAPERGDILAFMRTGGYSICEGFAFLLSRDLPAVVIVSEAHGAHAARDHIKLDPLNTPK